MTPETTTRDCPECGDKLGETQTCAYCTNFRYLASEGVILTLPNTEPDESLVYMLEDDGDIHQMVGWPTEMKEHEIPSGDSHLDNRCPSCGSVGLFRRRGLSGLRCNTTECRVRRFSPFTDKAPKPDADPDDYYLYER